MANTLFLFSWYTYTNIYNIYAKYIYPRHLTTKLSSYYHFSSYTFYQWLTGSSFAHRYQIRWIHLIFERKILHVKGTQNTKIAISMFQNSLEWQMKIIFSTRWWFKFKCANQIQNFADREMAFFIKKIVSMLWSSEHCALYQSAKLEIDSNQIFSFLVNFFSIKVVFIIQFCKPTEHGS